MASSGRPLTSIEICAGAGGQAVGLHRAKFRHLVLVEIDKDACKTLDFNTGRDNEWGQCEVLDVDVNDFDPFRPMKALGGRSLVPGELDLLAGGVPCPPFSVAGKQLGQDDDRDLFPRMLDLVDQLQPKAVMIENVRGILSEKFATYRDGTIRQRLEGSGYEICEWDLLEARDFGVPQLRPRAILVAIKKEILRESKKNGVEFVWPTATVTKDVTVAEALKDSMKARFDEHGEPGKTAYKLWLDKATAAGGVAPTLVGGSKKHGGADLGPSRAKAAWDDLGVNGLGVANDPDKCVPGRDLFRGRGPMLTVFQAAIIQGFPRDWEFLGGKTARYRQVGNAFPPPVAEAVGLAIAEVLQSCVQENVESVAPEATSTLFVLPAPMGEPGAASANDRGNRERALVR